jgi:hypothetical protein
MQIIEAGAPRWIVVEHEMGEADDLTVSFSNHRVLVFPRRRKPRPPHLKALSEDVAVEIGVEVCAAIMAPPTLGMQ